MKLAAARLPEAKAPFTIEAYENGAYRFSDSTWARFFKAKSDVVSASVKKLSGWFKAEGYRVGLDVFAPFLCPFVGQDMEALSRCCDWIKPMMYRKVYAPAGLPFEIDALCRAGCPGAKESWFYHMANGGRKLPDITFLRRDLEEAAARAACPIYPGVEVNRLPQIADIAAEDVAKSGNMLPEDATDVVLSWNLLCAPEDNLRAAAGVLGGTVSTGTGEPFFF